MIQARQAQSTYDALLQLKDAGLVAADAAGTIATVARIVDLGDAMCSGDFIVDITALETATGDENYFIILEGSDSADFSTGTPAITPLVILNVGHASTIPGAGATTSTVGRYVCPFTNEVNGHVFRYVRVYSDVAGTIATGVNFTAMLGKSRL